MEIDKTTLYDLSVFHHEEAFSLFHRLNETLTSRGKEQLEHDFSKPLKNYEEIIAVQDCIKFIGNQLKDWPIEITNGTLLMIEKFFVTSLDDMPSHPSFISAATYKLISGPDFALIKYSVGHFVDFIKGMQQFVSKFLRTETPTMLAEILNRIKSATNREEFFLFEKVNDSKQLSDAKVLALARYFKHYYKNTMMDLISLYGRLDAWYSMAVAAQKHGFVFPEVKKTEKPLIKIEGLKHILLQEPVAYDLTLAEGNNFMFLTGANMAGKSTFIKAVGLATYLAHIGMAVPAHSMSLSVFDGIISNINIADNIIKGESYFYNEVKRVKDTVLKINNEKNWLVLADELFKGTNVQDAMKCSTTVIEGFVKINNSLFIVSTHLYEIGDALKRFPNIVFRYFETDTTGGKLQFSYALKDGISNDRLGYLILKNEGVVKMLEDL